VDDRRAHFLTMLGDACAAADLANMRVELILNDGSSIGGVPSPRAGRNPRHPVAETGYANRLLVGSETVCLEDIARFAISSP
jgi:hypothetical protein